MLIWSPYLIEPILPLALHTAPHCFHTMYWPSLTSPIVDIYLLSTFQLFPRNPSILVSYLKLDQGLALRSYPYITTSQFRSICLLPCLLPRTGDAATAMRSGRSRFTSCAQLVIIAVVGTVNRLSSSLVLVHYQSPKNATHQANSVTKLELLRTYQLMSTKTRSAHTNSRVR